MIGKAGASARPHALGAQGRVVWGTALVRLLIGVAVYSLCFALLALLYNEYLCANVAEFIADRTCVWWPYVSYSEALPTNWQYLHDNGNGTYAARDLSTYYMLRNFKVPVVCALYGGGVLVVALVVLRRCVRALDAVTSAVSGLSTGSGEQAALPDLLAITRTEFDNVRLRMEAEAQAVRDAERRKNELVAYLAHDIKSPLTAVMGYLSMLEAPREMSDENRREYARIASEKALRLSGLVDDLFEVARYNLCAMEVEREHVDLRLLLVQVADELKPQAASRELALSVVAPDEVEVFVDPDKLARALSNIVRNAVAYADTGTQVLIDGSICAGVGADDSKKSCVIKVSDRGREISSAHIRMVFDKFYREDGARSAATGGAGLGLAIAREIVEAHGGTIEATSEQGVTTFTLVLPV